LKHKLSTEPTRETPGGWRYRIGWFPWSSKSNLHHPKKCPEEATKRQEMGRDAKTQREDKRETKKQTQLFRKIQYEPGVEGEPTYPTS
jgi:hypothetical protein